MNIDNKLEIVSWCLARLKEKGTSWARVAFTQVHSRSVDTLNGEVDKIHSSFDSAIGLIINVGGKYGTYSTNSLDINSLEDFLNKSIDTTRSVVEDPFRTLPSRDRICKDAVTGYEAEIFDSEGVDVDDSELIDIALLSSVWGRGQEKEGVKIVSEEAGVMAYDSFSILMDSEGLECKKYETGFSYGVEVTIEDNHGNLYTGYDWHASPFLKKLNAQKCGVDALRRAESHIGAKRGQGGKYNMVLDATIAGRMLSPVMGALNGFMIQQNDSFLSDSIGTKIFSEGLSVYDYPRMKGKTGSCYYDGEGVATKDGPVIENGVVKTYFINTYIANKMGIEPTKERATHLTLKAWPESGLDKDKILKMCGDGIYVTGFNGGNHNSATGDFSYGIEGNIIRDGALAEPVSGMLVTGNMIELWSNLIAVGEDAPDHMSNLIPTLAFKNVDFNA